MRKLIIGLGLVGCLACAKEGTPVNAQGKADYEVEKLFTYEGCTVYRFLDVRYHYWTDCRGSVSDMFCQQNGKSHICYENEVPTVK